jgi:hypothetical protein
LAESRSKDSSWKRLLPPAITLVIFFLIFERIPFRKLIEAFRGADYPRFFLLMLPNSLFYFGWDTLVLAVLMRWFHGPIRYGDLLPVRAVTYVVSLLNTNLARGAMAVYLTRQLRVPFFQIASTVLFLTLLELTHLAIWATSGMLFFPPGCRRACSGSPLVLRFFGLFSCSMPGSISPPGALRSPG